MDIHALEDMGLNHNEAIIYKALILLGQASAGELIKETKFHRNIVYDNLEKLMEKALVTFIIDSGKKIFQLAPPDMLTEFLENQQQELDKKLTIAKKIQKEIEETTAKTYQKQEATIYRGKKGIRVIFKELINCKGGFVSYGAHPISNEIMGKEFFLKFNKEHSARKKFSRSIFNESLREWGKVQQNKFFDVRYLHESMDPLSETIVYEDKVAVIVWTNNPITTLIHSKEVADSNREFFETMWQNAKE